MLNSSLSIVESGKGGGSDLYTAEDETLVLVEVAKLSLDLILPNLERLVLAETELEDLSLLLDINDEDELVGFEDSPDGELSLSETTSLRSSSSE